jgi:hypothetical protein
MFIVNSINNGVMPYWNPYLFSGVPFLADINHSFFYPFSTLFLVLDAVSALNVTVLLHLIITGVGAYLVSRMIKQSHIISLIAGLIWTLSEFTLSAASSNLSIIQSITWFPWIVLVLLGSFNKLRWFFFLPLLISFSLISGHPQLLTFLIFFSAIYLLVHRKYKQFASLAATLIVVGIINIGLILPFVELSIQSTRHLQAWEDKTKLSVPLVSLIQWVVPHFFSNTAEGIFWGPDWDKSRTISGYSTLISLLGFIFLFRKKRSAGEDYLFFIGWVSLIFALGNTIPFLWNLLERVPGLNSFRNPSSLVGLWSLSASLLVGPSIFEVHKFASRNGKLVFCVALALAAGVIGLLIVNLTLTEELWKSIDGLIGNRLTLGGFHTYARDHLILNSILSDLLLSVSSLIASVFILLRMKSKIWLLVLILGIDMFFMNRAELRFADSSIYSDSSKQVQWIQSRLNGQYRIISSSSYFPYVGIQDFWNNALFKPPFSPAIQDDLTTKSFDSLQHRADNLGADWNMVYEIPLINGYGAFVLNGTAEYWDDGNQYTPINDIDKVSLSDFRISDQAVKYVVIDTSLLPLNSLEYPADQYVEVYREDTFAILENSQALPIVRFESAVANDVVLEDANSNQMLFNYSLEKNDTILIKQTFYPGWKCWIDGTVCEIQRDGFTMRIDAPAGDHQVKLEFIPTGWPVIGYLSVFLWILYLLLVVRNAAYLRK